MAERLFSKAKQIVPAERNKFTPMHLEENCFLLLNKKFRHVNAVNSILTEKLFWLFSVCPPPIFFGKLVKIV